MTTRSYMIFRLQFDSGCLPAVKRARLTFGYEVLRYSTLARSRYNEQVNELAQNPKVANMYQCLWNHRDIMM